MGVIKEPQVIRLTKVSAGAAYDDLETTPVEATYRLVTENHAVENETNTFTSVRAFIKGHGYEHWLWEQKSPIAATLYWFEREISLEEGEQLAFRFTGCTSGDQLRAYLDGYRYKRGQRGEE